MAEVNLLQRINKLENTIIIKEETTLKKQKKKLKQVICSPDVGLPC